MTKQENADKIISYKGFDKDMKCRDFQYEIGKTYTHDGEPIACESGFHACEYPLDVFTYYPPTISVFAVVEQSGSISRKGSDSKVASSKISIESSLDLPGIINAAIEYTVSRCNPPTEAASNTGYQGAASNTGNRGAASNTGNRGAASNTGDYGAASNTGEHGAASNTGNRGAASNTGDYGAASNTGYRGAASNTGYYGAASNTGEHGAASNTGNRGAASNTRDYGAASNTGEHGVAASFGYLSKSKSSETGAIVCIYRNQDGEIVHIKASKVGVNGIKPNVWYTLNETGEFVELPNE